MADTKGLTVKIDADLHAEIRKYVESQGITMAEFVTAACDGFLHPKIVEKEETKMENMRTVAFQVPESLFQQIKDYLQRNNMTQKEFLLGLIKAELERDLQQREAAVEAVSDDKTLEDKVPDQGDENAFEGENPAVFAPETEVQNGDAAEEEVYAEEANSEEIPENADVEDEESISETLEPFDSEEQPEELDASEFTEENSTVDLSAFDFDTPVEDQEESESESEEESFGMVMGM